MSNDIPTLFRERLGVVTKNAATWSEELIQGVENMQVQYGIDVDTTHADAAPDIYIDANDSHMDWQKVRNVRIALRLRSVQPFYPNNVPYEEFMDISDTSGSDRYMRQTFSLTINIRN